MLREGNLSCSFIPPLVAGDNHDQSVQCFLRSSAVALRLGMPVNAIFSSPSSATFLVSSVDVCGEYVKQRTTWSARRRLRQNCMQWTS